jgi:CheY-like chemotaxis protein
MDHLKLLIVDDIEDNRLILKAICRKMKDFEIQEACDGLEAVEIAGEWHPHIILMDVMMPRLDGFQASKLIKERYPETIIMVVTAVMDPHMEENMASIGVAAYIHKPIDKDLIRFKLQSFGALLRSRKGNYIPLSKKEALNPFNSDIRNLKTIYDIVEPDDMMDFGMWILVRCEEKMAASCTKIDAALGLFYELMRHGTRNGQSLSIIIEESFEELYVTMKFEEIIEPKPKAIGLLSEMGNDCIVRENVVCVRLHLHHEVRGLAEKKVLSPCIISEVVTKEEPPILAVCEPEVVKEVRVMQSGEKEMLRQSFVNKTTAVEYVCDIGGDVLDEIRDLVSLDEEWKEKLLFLEEEPVAENIRSFVDNVLRVYVHAINNLFEFTALGYALSTLGSFLKDNADMIISDPKKLKTMIMLMDHMGSDLASWREHIFGLQDAGDIHYLDSSFFSSCMQIEGIISEKDVHTDDDDEMEFF